MAELIVLIIFAFIILCFFAYNYLLDIYKKSKEYDKLNREINALKIEYINKINKKYHNKLRPYELKLRDVFDILINNLEEELEETCQLNKMDEDFRRVYKLVKSGKNVFITGGAGVGKSYILQHLREYIPELKNNITSTTGISAINVDGVTIHSWAGIGKINFDYKDKSISLNEQIKKKIERKIKDNKNNQLLIKKIKETKILAIDEISMLSDDIFCLLDLYLQKIRNTSSPFGGIQIILIGDFCQLPPIITDNPNEDNLHYVFNSKSFKNLNLECVVLETVHRQEKDIEFAHCLNSLRFNKDIEKAEKYLSACVTRNSKDEIVPHLFFTNNEVNKHNDMCLKRCNGKPLGKMMAENYFVEPVYKEDKITYDYIKDKNGNIKKANIYDFKNKKGEDIIEKNTKAVNELELKTGCRVMVIRNIDIQNGIANGTIGTVKEAEEERVTISVYNKKVREERDYSITKEKFVSECKGKYILRQQYPLILAYALTVHKAQGSTFDKIVIDLSHCWKKTAGLAYTAFSRVKTAEGLFIKNKFPADKFLCGNGVREFYESIHLR